MSIVTKTGDTGQTARFGGSRVPKNDPSVRANGDIDELNSAIGLLCARTDISDAILKDLQMVQCACFSLGAQIATPQDALDTSKSYIPKITEADISFLEARITEIEAQLPSQKHFLLPGGCPGAAMSYWIRAIARRAERSAVEALGARVNDSLVIQYLNRVSDYFYVLARFLNLKGNLREQEWLGGEGELPPKV